MGGEPAATGAWPWAASLQITQSNGTFLCGGSLIAPAWILTAAHCVTQSNGTQPAAANVRAILGRILRNGAGGEEIVGAEIIRHPQYNPGNDWYDIALVRLSSASSQQTISLISAGDSAITAPTASATVIGWGTTQEGGSATNELRQVVVQIVSDANCSAAYGPQGISIDAVSQLCASAPGKDSCQGDSGGPLMVQRPSGQWAVAGIVSTGIGCARPDFPGIYAEVLGGLSFITNTVGATPPPTPLPSSTPAPTPPSTPSPTPTPGGGFPPIFWPGTGPGSSTPTPTPTPAPTATPASAPGGGFPIFFPGAGGTTPSPTSTPVPTATPAPTPGGGFPPIFFPGGASTPPPTPTPGPTAAPTPAPSGGIPPIFFPGGGTTTPSGQTPYPAGCTGPGCMLSPIPGSTLPASGKQTFEWTTDANVAEFILQIGSADCGVDYFYRRGRDNAMLVEGLPTDGSTVCARLYTQPIANGEWISRDYVYQAAGGN
ncbi:MAG: serine protease [Dehalococcoidia bacterium]